MLMAISPLQPSDSSLSQSSSQPPVPQQFRVSQINPNTTLCLACSSSLPPRLIRNSTNPLSSLASKSTSPKSQPPLVEFSPEVFLTRCCGRPICPSCLEHHPRLARYNPCLACLGGVGAVGSRSQGKRKVDNGRNVVEVDNIDGAVRDEDMFAIGEEEEEEDVAVGEAASSTPPPAYVELGDEVSQFWSTVKSTSGPLGGKTTSLELGNEAETSAREGDASRKRNDDAQTASTAPSKYYIKPGDTLNGIALRSGVDGRSLCRLNNLPSSTLTTTPHLLHTRSFITLPPSHKVRATQLQVDPGTPSEETKERERLRKLEQAQKRFQFVTKEVDWRVAKAYVMLADDDEDGNDDGGSKEGKNWKEFSKKYQPGLGGGNRDELEGRAVDRYLDDDEWETRTGGKVDIQRFPGSPGHASGSRGGDDRNGRGG